MRWRRGESGLPRVDRHHLGVRHDVGSTDLEDARHGFGVFDGGDEVAQHVANRDGLAARVDPFGGDHDRQDLGEVSQHLETRRTRADDDGGTKLDRLDRSRGEHLPDVVAAAEMRAEVGVVVAEPAEIDDARHSGRFGGAPEVLRDGPFSGHPVGALADAVDEEHRDVDAFHRGAQVAADVGAHHLDVLVPRCRVELAGIPHHAADGVSSCEELGDETAADIPRCAGDEYSQLSMRHCDLAASSRQRRATSSAVAPYSSAPRSRA